MWIGVLGPVRVLVDGVPVEVGGRRSRALVSRLAVDAGRVVGLDALAAAVWSDRVPGDVRHAMQALVSRLRARIGDHVRAAHGGYLLDVAPDRVDVGVFEQRVRDGRRALAESRPAEAARLLREAEDLWRGAPLADAGDAEYAVAVVARLDAQRREAVEARVGAELRLGHHQQLVPELEQLTATDPLRERPHLLLMRALHADGRAAAALAVYEDYRKRLADELGADPGEEIRSAHLAALRDPAPTRPRDQGNLPAALTSFVGRTSELEQVDHALRTSRLVTLVGPGGVGKTRLATVAAGSHREATGRPTWLVDLATVADPDDLPQTVLDGLGPHGSAATSPTRAPTERTLVDALAGSDALLLLDNCEHLLDDLAPLVEELLGRCPALGVLATSREPLRASGERLCPVDPLPIDAPAVQLFRDRATAVRPDFELTDGNRDTVADVCRRLDGLPLAIELAAARLRSMPLDLLAERLDDRFRLLTSGRRTAPPRHRTLRAVVAWSWDLLDDDLRDAAERLAVFPGTFPPSAAERLGVAPDLLDPLVDKSLLQLAEHATPRYRMSGTVREYGVERLAESGRRDATEAAHLDYVVDLAERAEPWLRGPHQLPWLASLRAERDDLLAAYRFALGSGRLDAAVRLAAALSLFWTIHGDHTEVAARLRSVLDATELVADELPADALATVTAAYLLNAVLAGLGAEARSLPRRAPASGAPTAVLAASVLADDPSTGAELLRPLLDHPDPWKRGLMLLFRSFLGGEQGGWRDLSTDLSAAADAFREAGDRWGLATALTYLGMTHSALGEHSAAVAELGEAVELASDLGHAEPQRVWLATAKLYAGDVDTARAELTAVASQRTSADAAVLARLRLADLARQDGDLDEAAARLAAAGELLGSRAGSNPLFLASSGGLAVARGDLADAAAQLRTALALAADMPDPPMTALVGVAAARLAHRRGDLPDAAEALGAADAIRGTPDHADTDATSLADLLRAELGARAYTTAHDRGAGLTAPAALGRLTDLLAPPTG